MKYKQNQPWLGFKRLKSGKVPRLGIMASHRLKEKLKGQSFY